MEEEELDERALAMKKKMEARAAAAAAKNEERAKAKAEKDAQKAAAEKKAEELKKEKEREAAAVARKKREEELANKPYMKRAAARKGGAPVEEKPAASPKPKKKVGGMSAAAKEAKRIEEERNARRAAAKAEKAARDEEQRLHGDDKNWKIRRMVNSSIEELGVREQNPDYTSEVMDDRILVCVRTRPFLAREEKKKDFEVLSFDGDDRVVIHNVKKNVDLSLRLDQQSFNFDFGFDGNIENDTVYTKTLQPLIASIFAEDKRISMFAFGQTGSGKTFTMKSMFGAAISDMFANPALAERGLSLSVSYYEVYQGKVLDLFNNRAAIDILEDQEGNVNLRGLTEDVVNAPEDVLNKLAEGDKARAQRATQMNDTSSRSHAIMQIVVQDESAQSYGRLTLIDLAGSEKGSDTPDSDKEIRGEAAEINKSLLALKECIRAMEHSGHTPFRGSKLTMILKDSLIGAECRAIMIACIAPGYLSADATLNTLRYADRLKGGAANDEVEVSTRVAATPKRPQNERLNRLANPENRSNRPGGSPSPSPPGSPRRAATSPRRAATSPRRAATSPRRAAGASTPRSAPAKRTGIPKASGIPSASKSTRTAAAPKSSQPSGIPTKSAIPTSAPKPAPKAAPDPSPAPVSAPKLTAAVEPSASPLPSPTASAEPDESLASFFVKLGIPEDDANTYADKMAADGFDDVDSLNDIEKDEYEEFGLKKGHLRKLLRHLGK